jgi:hypothetical protein
MFKHIPESLKEKIKGKEEQLEKAILELKEYAKKDLGE